MNSRDLPIEIFADGADISKMIKYNEEGIAKGFTTNPFFLNEAGITDYERFAKDLLKAIPDKSLSFEVLSDDLDSMEREARKISKWSDTIYVKIPIVNTKGESTSPLIKKLSMEGLKLNVTVIFTVQQAKIAAESLSPDVESIISIFAGRIGATGVDPMPIIKQAAEIVKSIPLPKTKLLWAATREVYNIFQAIESGCSIITVGYSLLDSLTTIGKPLEQSSIEMVKMFYDATRKGGFRL
ncbi:MAG: transaldolase family protein [Spirochaetia bacterium]|jgi:transaldolase